jgi:ADP-heptose:LPS heptosyltransferase
MLYFGKALGDNLLCTAVLRELRRRGQRDLWMMTPCEELFRGNDDVDATVPGSERWFEPVVIQLGGKFIVPSYTRHDWQNDAGDPPPPAHIIAVMCHLAGITGQVALRPYLNLQPEELSFGKYGERQIAIQSSGLGAAMSMHNKEWFPERFQAVVDGLKNEFQFVQLGGEVDPPLRDVIDLRGKTTGRQSAAVLGHSVMFVGLVGFLMHLARAVNRRSVIVYGGRERPQQSGYSCNENLATAPACSPCWRWNRCEYERKCMSEIEPAAVIAAVRRQAVRVAEPIRDDVCEIGPVR